MSEAENGEWTCRMFLEGTDRAEKATTNVTLLGKFIFVIDIYFFFISDRIEGYKKAHNNNNVVECTLVRFSSSNLLLWNLAPSRGN